MIRSRNEFVGIVGGFAAAVGVGLGKLAVAAGVLYANPGWYNALEGNSAYYHDPDGPNPNYTRTSGPDDNNIPGGQTDQPALVNPGGCPADCSALAVWQNQSSQWDGSAPGVPLGGPPGSPPVPPPAPGGVGAFTDGATTFIRIQDTGDPTAWGWPDKGAQGFTGGPRQEGNNRKIEFKHEMIRDAAFSGRPDILDFGVTISFRTRIATAATGPLDAIYAQSGGTTPTPWPTGGIGYPVANTGRGMFMITQTGESGPGQLGFGLLDSNTISTLSNSAQLTKTGLVMNNQSAGAGGSPDTGNATAGTLNVVQIPNSSLHDWHEFWITVQKLPSPINGNTHEVKVYKDGSLTPETFDVILGTQNEFGSGSHIGMGLSSGSAFGAYDVDFFAYKEGVVPPTLAGVPGDFNSDGKVDAGDYATWRKNNNTNNALANDNGLGTPIGSAHYNLWRANFGNPPGSGSGLGQAAVPEPSSAILLMLAAALVGIHGRLRS